MFFYDQLISELRVQIEQKYGSIAEFCNQNSINRSNLFKVFSGKHDISVGLYLRVATSLGVVAPLASMPECPVSLREYLSVNHDFVIHSILSIHMR